MHSGVGVTSPYIFNYYFMSLIFNLMFIRGTTVYKAGLSTVGDLYNLVSKNVTKYAVLTTLKILKITKKSPIF